MREVRTRVARYAHFQSVRQNDGCAVAHTHTHKRSLRLCDTPSRYVAGGPDKNNTKKPEQLFKKMSNNCVSQLSVQ